MVWSDAEHMAAYDRATSPGVSGLTTVCFALPLQELATVFIEKLDVKIVLLNNQHLGMVMQWEDRFYKVSMSEQGSRQEGMS